MMSLPDSLPLRVLVTDDSLVNRRLASSLLRQEGHAVSIAYNGDHAVQKLQQSDFDLVLMDIEMPVMDGISATRVIRQQDQSAGRHTTVVALTTNTNRDECLAAGMDAFLNKPLNLGALRSILSDVARGTVA